MTALSETTLKAALCNIIRQAHTLTFDGFLDRAESRAEYDLPKAAYAKSKEDIRSIVAGKLKKLTQISDSASPLISRKPNFVATAPLSVDRSRRGPIYSTRRDSEVPKIDPLAEFVHDRWLDHYFGPSPHTCELYAHPDSTIYREKVKCSDRSEEGVVTLHIGQVVLDMYASTDPKVRQAAATFERSRTAFVWDAYVGDPVGAAAAYRPEAHYMFDGQRVDVYLPMAFHWEQPVGVATFLKALFTRISASRCEVWCPGLEPGPNCAS